MTSQRLDFDAVKGQARFETVLARYGLETKGRGAERMLRCPFHDDTAPSCSVHLEKKIFHCFACGGKGTILDFIARMEACSIVEAARLLAGWAALPVPISSAGARARARSACASANKPLKFALHLAADHPYLAARGVSPSMAARFGLGHCDGGIMKGRICIPLHDERGRLVAYAGRWPAAPPPGEPRYRLPRGFRKNLVLFNAHRVAAATHLVIVEGCWSVFRLDGLGIAAVALMGRTLSGEQEAILRRSSAERITLLLDGDTAGRMATPDIQAQLTRHFSVHAPDLPDGSEPDTMAEDSLLAAIRAEARP